MTAREFSLLRPHLQSMDLLAHHVLYEPGDILKYMYFPNRGLISLVVVLKTGKTVEAGIVGKEGASGTALSAGINSSALARDSPDFRRGLQDQKRRLSKSVSHRSQTCATRCPATWCFSGCRCRRPRRVTGSTKSNSGSRVGC